MNQAISNLFVNKNQGGHANIGFYDKMTNNRKVFQVKENLDENVISEFYAGIYTLTSGVKDLKLLIFFCSLLTVAHLLSM